ncbi:MAG: hypothetical protein ACK5FV_13280 [Bacteroidota bacterium]|jgi:hypothetical protein
MGTKSLKATVTDTSRRQFIKVGAFSMASMGIWGFPSVLQAASTSSGISQICRRLAGLGWRDLLLDVTGGQLDLTADDLERRLLAPLSKIDRSHPGFGDFSLSGNKPVEPGHPDRSLLYHAFASATVVANRRGEKLEGFPTLAEIEALENFIYGSRKATLKDLTAGANPEDLAIVVFALNYRSTPLSVTGYHAQLCFSRTGIARLGTIDPYYDAEKRAFTGIDPDRPYDFRVVPRRFAPYLAKRVRGYNGQFGLQDPQDGDEALDFWVPVHKLFSGTECISGMNLEVRYDRGMQNDEIASFHNTIHGQGLTTGWTGSDLENYPFVIKDEKIASLSVKESDGSGLLVPLPDKLIREAYYKGERLTFPHSAVQGRDRRNVQISSLFVMPASSETLEPGYYLDSDQDSPRNAPEYINVRHQVRNGQVHNLNDHPDVIAVIRKGGYDAQHYIDSAGDGWVGVTCKQLEQSGITATMPAFCAVGLPDFLPDLNQRDLMAWWQNVVPKPMRASLWTVPPLALSQARIAANVELPIGFSLYDKTVTAIVAQLDDSPKKTEPTVQKPNGPVNYGKVGLPDGSPGLFDPGWDVSMGVRSMDGGTEIHKYLVGHGLGSPFIEDAKLCAALGAYWPALAPDATRQFEPEKIMGGIPYPWPSIVPQTDEELGMEPSGNGKLMPWDGVPGPKRRVVDGKPVIAYTAMNHVDYIDILGTMTAVLTARIGSDEYKARALSMAAVYWSLGIKEGNTLDPDNYRKLMLEKSAWAVFSFKAVSADDAELQKVAKAANHRFSGSYTFRFELYRWGRHWSDPADFKTKLVEVLEEVTAYSDGRSVIKKTSDQWKLDTSIPT